MPKIFREDCNNCGTFTWAAKNDDFCTSCEKQWYEAFNRVFTTKHNHLQDGTDRILNHFSTSTEGNLHE